MRSNEKGEHLVLWSGFEFDLETLKLRKNGIRLRIEQKPALILARLLEQPGQVVKRDDLVNLLWSDEQHGDFDHRLNKAIHKLRCSLGDDPAHPRFVETLSRYGYRFTASIDLASRNGESAPERAHSHAEHKESQRLPEQLYDSHSAAYTAHTTHGDQAGIATVISTVEALEDASEPAPADPADARAGRQASKRRSRRTLWVAVGTVGVVGSAAAVATWYALRPLPSLRVTGYRQITNDGQQKQIAGTDGTSLYLNLFQPNRLGIVPVTGGAVTPLSIDRPWSGNRPTCIHSVSPDGAKLLVFSDVDALSGNLWVVDAHGGGARFLAKGISYTAKSATWSPDGGTVLYCTPHGELYTIPSESGNRQLLLMLASRAPAGTPFTVGDPVWSPDRSRIRFVRDGRYWEATQEGKNVHEILPNWHASNPKYGMCCGRWTPDGDFFLFVAAGAPYSPNPATGRQIWALDERRSWLRHPSPDPIPLSNGPGFWGALEVSSDGKTVYSTALTSRGELVSYDAKSKQMVPYLGGISAEQVAFSEDGKSLVYVTFPEGILWRANRDGSGLQQLTNGAMHPIDPHWSPDGTQILFYETVASNPPAIFTVSSQGGTPRRLLPGDEDGEVANSWSPDGKKVAFVQLPRGATDPHAGARIRILTMDTRRVTDVPPSPKPCRALWWSPNGRYILGLTLDRDDLALFDFRTNSWSMLNPGFGGINSPTWSRDGNFIYFESSRSVKRKSTDPGVYRIRTTGGRAERVLDLKGFRGTGVFGVWFGLDRDDTPLLLRDAGMNNVYALTLERN